MEVSDSDITNSLEYGSWLLWEHISKLKAWKFTWAVKVCTMGRIASEMTSMNFLPGWYSSLANDMIRFEMFWDVKVSMVCNAIFDNPKSISSPGLCPAQKIPYYQAELSWNETRWSIKPNTFAMQTKCVLNVNKLNEKQYMMRPRKPPIISNPISQPERQCPQILDCNLLLHTFPLLLVKVSWARDRKQSNTLLMKTQDFAMKSNGPVISIERFTFAKKLTHTCRIWKLCLTSNKIKGKRRVDGLTKGCICPKSVGNVLSIEIFKLSVYFSWKNTNQMLPRWKTHFGHSPQCIRQVSWSKRICTMLCKKVPRWKVLHACTIHGTHQTVHFSRPLSIDSLHDQIKLEHPCQQ